MASETSSKPDAAADQRIRVFLFFYKRPDITFEQFKEHYENSHMPLMKSLGGEDFPISHKRRYITPSNILFGTEEDFPYDAISELEFENQAHFERFSALANREDVKEKREEDEKKFVDMSKMRGIWQMDEKITTRA